MAEEKLTGNLASANLLFITLDSLRLDAAQSAALPSLGSLEGPVACYTHGNFTLPAHFAFFTGFLPLPLDADHRFLGGTYSRLFRPASSRPAPGEVAISFDATTIISSFAAAGARVIGMGGVPYFDPRNSQISFAPDFPEFHYVGYSANSDYGNGRTFAEAAHHSSIARLRDWLAAGPVDPRRQHLIFVNEPSTHFPFVCPATSLTAADDRLLVEFDRYVRLKRPVPDRLARTLLPWGIDRQRVILEWLDTMLGELFDMLAGLRRQTLVVICGDHGEAFGDENRVGHFLNLDAVLHVPLWAKII